MGNMDKFMNFIDIYKSLGLNQDLFNKLDENISNNNETSLYQKDEIEEKLPIYPKIELEINKIF